MWWETLHPFATSRKRRVLLGVNSGSTCYLLTGGEVFLLCGGSEGKRVNPSVGHVSSGSSVGWILGERKQGTFLGESTVLWQFFLKCLLVIFRYIFSITQHITLVIYIVGCWYMLVYWLLNFIIFEFGYFLKATHIWTLASLSKDWKDPAKRRRMDKPLPDGTCIDERRAFRGGLSWESVHGYYRILGGGLKYFIFSPLLGEDSHFDWYFSTGLKPPTSIGLGKFHRNVKKDGFLFTTKDW